MVAPAGVDGLSGHEFNYVNVSDPGRGKVTVGPNAKYALLFSSFFFLPFFLLVFFAAPEGEGGDMRD